MKYEGYLVGAEIPYNQRGSSRTALIIHRNAVSITAINIGRYLFAFLASLRPTRSSCL
jgi:hypothetical protein